MSAPWSRAARAVTRRAARAAGRLVPDLWPLLQATASATVAWLVARQVFGHDTPYFAPIAAMIALTADLGERGLNAIRVLGGVIFGLVVGELVLFTVGTGAGAMALGVLVAITVARAVRGPQVVVVQAAVSVILVVAVGDAANGLERLVDVLIGAGVALTFTQLLFPPEPLRLLRRAEKAALKTIARGLDGVADAIAEDDDALAARAVRELRDIRDELAELRRARRVSRGVIRTTAVWRTRTTFVVRENENADHLDLLGGSCLMLARLAESAGAETRRGFESPVRGLAEVVATLAAELDDRDARQRAADRALELATRITVESGPDDPDRTFLAQAVRTAAADVIAFAGVELTEAIEAIRAGALERRVSPVTPPPGRLTRWIRRFRVKPRRDR